MKPFTSSFDAHAQNIATQKRLLRKWKSLESFDTEIMKILRKFQYLAKKTFSVFIIL